MPRATFNDYVPDHLPSAECWPWRGQVVQRYPGAPPRARWSGRWATRVLYELRVGPIPPGLELDHLCSNTVCVNPAHLEPVTKAENMRRMSERQTHCKHGHEFNEANTYWKGDNMTGLRQCRPCNAAAQRRRKARLRSVPA